MPSALDRKCFGTLFEYRFHAYTDLRVYFFLAFLLNLGFAVWCLIVQGAISSDISGGYKLPAGGTTTSQSSAENHANLINLSLMLVMFTGFGVAGVGLLIALSLPCLPRSAVCAGFSLFWFFLYTVAFIAKLGILIFAIVLIWGDGQSAVAGYIPSGDFNSAWTFTLGELIADGVQLIFGTLIMVCVGALDAVSEAKMVVTGAVTEEDEQYYEPFLHGPRK